MFSFIKKNAVFLQDLTEGFVDIHSHLLFGIDDGAQSAEDTKHLLEAFIDLSFKKSITTPHTTMGIWNNTTNSILSKYEEVKKLFPKLTGSLQLQAASEYMMDDYFNDLYKTEPLLTLKDKYILVEISYRNPPLQLSEIIFDLQLKGYIPVLAHPERYIYYHSKDLEKYHQLKRSGCLFQLNLLSVVGAYGSQVSRMADLLLKENLYDFAGSDVHRMEHIALFKKKIQIKHIDQLKEVMARNTIFL
ncbi:MAG: histidinol phosphatase [Bacteroidota bacterium]|nr:histidinol phosphatase [Bacteroidota bacterium]